MKHILFKNKKIFYNTGGKGMPVILIHGFAEDSDVWQYQVNELQKKNYTIIPDLPGSGSSEMIEGTIQIEDCADVVKAITDAERNHNNFTTFTVIGHSMGGYIALAFAEKYPELLNGLGLFHSTAYPDDDAKKEARKKGIDFIKNNGAEIFLRSTAPNLFSLKTKDESSEMIEDFINLYKKNTPQSLIQYYNAMMQRPDRISVLKNITSPVLFVTGKNDKAVSLQSSLQQCYLPSVSHIHILQNSAHMGLWEEKAASNIILQQFLSAILV